MASNAVEPSTPLSIKPDAWVAAVQNAWRASGHRITEPRVRVLRCIASYVSPFSAEQLHADLQQSDTAPGRATVYRSLEQLCSEGWVTRIHVNNNESAYSMSWPGHIHHLVCTSCGRVVAFEGCLLESLIASLVQQTGFKIEEHLLEIYGCCADCQHPSMT